MVEGKKKKSQVGWRKTEMGSLNSIEIEYGIKEGAKEAGKGYPWKKHMRDQRGRNTLENPEKILLMVKCENS